MANRSKFAALAEFRQIPTEPEPDVSPSVVEAEGGVVDQGGPAGAKAVVTEEPMTVIETVTVDLAASVEVPPGRARAAKVAPPAPSVPRPRGRPPGKRSDPEWKLFSHFLKRSTQRQATAILFETEADHDLSDVLQSLLEQWVARQRAKM